MTERTTRIVRLDMDETDLVRVAPGFGRGAASITVNRADSRLTVAVRFAEDLAVPKGILAMGATLYSSLEFDRGGGESWKLEQVEPVVVSRLVVEAATERSAASVSIDFGEESLVGHLFWSDPLQDDWITVGDIPYRVHRSEPEVRGAAVITEATKLELFTPGVRSGVDMVILADCSASMATNDLDEKVRTLDGRMRRMKRSEAQRLALLELLDRRIKTRGRVSRIAILEFHAESLVRFPGSGGMVELDGQSPDALIREYRAAVHRLEPQPANTDIGQALTEAADLLYRHGHPGNEKVIVLISDGADWARGEDDATGEVVRASDEAVSLMEHLNREREVRLHAIGVSTPELYARWSRASGQGHSSWKPNHELLQALTVAGKGAAATIGGLDVLTSYFSSLGSGSTQSLPRPKAGKTAPALSDDARKELAAAAGAAYDTSGWQDAIRQLYSVAGACNELASERIGKPAFDRAQLKTSSQHLLRGVVPATNSELGAAILRLLGAVEVLASVRSFAALDGHTALCDGLGHAAQPFDRRMICALIDAEVSSPGEVLAATANRLGASVRSLHTGFDILPVNLDPTANAWSPSAEEFNVTAPPKEAQETSGQPGRLPSSPGFRYVP